MLIFAIFTLGYFAGVFTALAVFPPKVSEIEEQEADALKPLLKASKREIEGTFEKWSDNRAIATR